MVLVVFLTVRRAELATFHDYERAAARVMARHGGRIARTVVVDTPAEEDLTEIHVVDFPDAAAFARYRADPEMATLADQRARAVVKTELWRGEPGPDYT